jgi:hypothetical protein
MGGFQRTVGNIIGGRDYLKEGVVMSQYGNKVSKMILSEVGVFCNSTPEMISK